MMVVPELFVDETFEVGGRFGSTRLPDPIAFVPCPKPTLGVELEVSLIDAQTGHLVPMATQILDAIDDKVRFKPELFQSIVEINTDVCDTVADVHRDLSQRLAQLHRACDNMGLTSLCTGTHPGAKWPEIPITKQPRYQNMVQNMRWPARRLLICGVHVHVGVQSGEHAIALTNAMAVFLPHMLALSASSPYWMGMDTGLASSRTKIFESLPTAGLPPKITNWREFSQLMRTLLTAGSIASIREIWWDVRPHPGFGTLEMRMCDGINTLSELCSIAAFIQCLVVYIQDLYNCGETLPALQHWTLNENKWRASRYGLDATIIRNERGEQVPLRDHIHETIALLKPTATQLKCEGELGGLQDILSKGASYSRQLQFFEQHHSFDALALHLAKEFRHTQPLA